MEMAEIQGKSRRQKRKGQRKKGSRETHFQIAGFGGFEESQVICFLWDIVKALEPGADERVGRGRDKEPLYTLEKQLRRRIRVEMRRYFVRRRRRNVKLVCGSVAFILCVFCLFGFLLGIDRVSGSSMYPYLNHGDWIVYGRTGRELQKNDVVVFEKDGENLVKRIVGLPGDTVEISKSGGRVVINGILISEDYVTLPDTQEEESQMGPPLTVMDGQYLVLGDNRKVSIDSRDSGMGTVPAESMLGKVILIIRGRG